MKLPTNINRDHLLQAINKINSEGIPKDADSQYYDLLFEDKKYPPKLVVSYANLFANGEVLDRNSFNGGLDTECFKLLEENHFEVIPKQSINNDERKFWIEKTIVHGRVDRNNGPRSLGSALWSPQKSQTGADIYKNMRKVKAGDIILHLIDNEKIIGYSSVKKEFVEINISDGTNWDGPAYIIELENYSELKSAIMRDEFLSEKYHSKLSEIAKDSEVFFNQDFNLRQGAYLTPCPIELLKIINSAYYDKELSNLPFYDSNENNNLIKAKEIPMSLKKIFDDFNNSGFYISEHTICRFVCSLITKPFLLLTGLSGSGKTKLALSFAKWICENDNQYCLVPVGADWTNREPLLGFPDALSSGKYIPPENGVLDILMRAAENVNLPYFLILDEMNLSHVERYFADFLSAMESGESIPLHPESENWKGSEIRAKLRLPKNLFIIGTVNIDETTYMFSPKVLDRANVIEFRVNSDDMSGYFNRNIKFELNTLNSKGSDFASSFLALASSDDFHLEGKEELTATLLKYFQELKKVGAEFGYRTASEILRFTAVVQKINPEWSKDQIVDAAILQKLLPKLHGSRRKLEPVLKSIGNLCLTGVNSFDILIKSEDINPSDIENYKHPLSFEKIKRMYNGLVNNGFTSFAEA
jgi:5-methylcytosine-specific restriction protein B